jgi:hypothetical protein
MEFVRDRGERMSFPPNWYVALEAAEIARGHGLLVYPRRPVNGLYGDHVLVAPPLIVDRDGIDELIDLLDATLGDLNELLARHLAGEIVPVEADETVKRYEQVEDVPDYAVGEIADAEPVADANVTGAMQTLISALDADEEDGPP